MRLAATSPPRTPTSCSPPRRCSSPGTRARRLKTFTVQPKFEGNALDFGMVIPTPTQPKLHEMPKDFFKHLAYYTIMKSRAFPHSKLLPQFEGRSGGLRDLTKALARNEKADRGADKQEQKPTVVVLEIAWSARSITRSSRPPAPTICSPGSRTTSTATPAMKPRCSIISRRNGSSR